MFSISFLTVIALTFAVNAVLADELFNEQDAKDAKMVFCSGCKDKAVHEKLEVFYGCLKDNFPDDYKKGEETFNAHKDDHEACWTEMSKLLTDLKKAHEDNFKTMVKCFEAAIPDRKILESCH